MWGWLMEAAVVKEGLKCVSTVPGVQYVTTTGKHKMQMWSVNNLDFYLEVRFDKDS